MEKTEQFEQYRGKSGSEKTRQNLDALTIMWTMLSSFYATICLQTLNQLGLSEGFTLGNDNEKYQQVNNADKYPVKKRQTDLRAPAVYVPTGTVSLRFWCIVKS